MNHPFRRHLLYQNNTVASFFITKTSMSLKKKQNCSSLSICVTHSASNGENFFPNWKPDRHASLPILKYVPVVTSSLMVVNSARHQHFEDYICCGNFCITTVPLENYSSNFSERIRTLLTQQPPSAISDPQFGRIKDIYLGLTFTTHIGQAGKLSY